jgi:hypothetical protein
MLELALHILDVLQNAVEAGAENVSLTLVEDWTVGWLTITVTDDGRGMDAGTLARVADPFYTTRSTRHVGLGLPLLKMAAGAAGGTLSLRSSPGHGTTVQSLFRLSHPDRQPLGDMAATLLAFLLSGRSVRLNYLHRLVGSSGDGSQPVLRTPQESSFEFDSAEIRAELEGLPLNHPLVARWLAGFLRDGEANLSI